MNDNDNSQDEQKGYKVRRDFVKSHFPCIEFEESSLLAGVPGKPRGIQRPPSVTSINLQKNSSPPKHHVIVLNKTQI